MKAMPKAMVIVIVLLSLLSLIPPKAYGEAKADRITIQVWEMKWESDASHYSPETVLEEDGWLPIQADDPVTVKPDEATGAWIKIDLPEIADRSGIYIKKMFGQNVQVYLDSKLIYDNKRSYRYDDYRLLLPLSAEDTRRSLLIHTETTMKSLGISEEVVIGDYQQLTSRFFKVDILDVVLGSSFLFVSIVMLTCSFFLSRQLLPAWYSLSTVIISIGLFIIIYSPFMYTYYGTYGTAYIFLFDVAMIIFMPALTYYFECMFGSGPYGIIRKFRSAQVVYSLVSLFSIALYDLYPNVFYPFYHIFTGTLLGISLIIQFILIVGMTIVYVVKGNKDAIIISTGFSLFAALAVSDLIFYYTRDSQYTLYLWKWGVVAFIFSLIVLLGKRFTQNHEQIVRYSKELEMYNYQLQRSEKMEVISQLAASVAHEVRNPLQVTRGFLQLLSSSNQNEKERSYLKLAIEELDRAATIITNYLTFAKPQLEQIKVLNLAEELSHVEGILVPLANLQGGKIEINVPANLYVCGNSSKLKQAVINLIKNSIESLRGNGRIHLWAYEKKGEIIIHIRDNGEGMEENMLKRLGEPYFSNKSKGTGLGLMVTFRIIELMEGKLEFKSEKGVGTEAIIRFPAASEKMESAMS
ncbi:ATP-binding protein [Paenibacillus sepulcri]|uniref:histidine kinase n=1 Tax=Paenibacillus sepulcri TaxID=359917 RepID=A0ABS7BY75_9BACL|nr:HAMP domain-containing histidine kinase [Paenibacillus sepulcri]